MWNVLRSIGSRILIPASQQSSKCASFSSFVPSSTGFGFKPRDLLQPWRTNICNFGGLLEDNTTSGIMSSGVFVPSRGYKVKGKVKRRCKDCYLIWIEGIVHNLCPTHPRHKQRQKPKQWVNLRILTHATQSPKRPW